MEAKTESLSLFEFEAKFGTDESCLEYLAQKKWEGGYVCPKCKNEHYCKGSTPHGRQCTKCRYVESPTAGTLFHKVKFPLRKAFYIVYLVSTNKKGISSTELSRKLGMRQKTCWGFRRKVVTAMKSSGSHPIFGSAEVDECVIGGQEEGVRGRKNGKKKLVVIAIEKRGKGVGRVYGKVIPKADNKNLGGFMEAHIDPGATVKTDEWSGYKPLTAKFKNLEQIPSGKKGEGFHDMHRVIMGLKGWLRGMHHRVKHLQAYIDEYTYRYNRANMGDAIFYNLLDRMVKAGPCPYKAFIA